MNSAIFIRFTFCIFILAAFLYTYILKQNTITELRLQIPSLTQELAEINQENSRLQFKIDQFENPAHLLELSRKPEYRHLKHPLLKEVIQLKVKK